MKLPEQLRKYNTLKVLRHISDVKITTKKEVAKVTALTMVTVSSIINKLIDNKVLIKNGVDNSNIGRNTTMYSFNTEENHIIGINMGIDYMSFREEDLEGNILGRKYMQVNLDITYDEVINEILLYIKNKNHIIGIGITIPGVSNKITGRVEFLPNLKSIKGKYLQKDIRNKTNIYTIVEKDVYAGVGLYGGINFKKSLALISIIGGIGCGIIFDNKVLKGHNQMAGEIGHISINSEGLLCSCGQKGCLEQYASDYAICERLGMSINSIIENTNNGDIKCIEVLKKACDGLDVLIGYVAKFYNPEEIVINCKWLFKIPYILHYFNQTISKHKLNVDVIYDKHNYEKGAVYVIKKKLFHEIENNALLGG